MGNALDGFGRMIDTALGSPSHLKSSIPHKRHAAQARFLGLYPEAAAYGVTGDNEAAYAEAAARHRAEQAREAEARRRAEEQLEAQRVMLRRLEDEARKESAARQEAEQEARHMTGLLSQQTETQRAQLNRTKTNLTTQLQEKSAAHDETHQRLIEINTQTACEEKDIAEFKVERADPSTKVIITLGMTGGGKSTLCNRIKGDGSMFGNEGGFATSANGQSCTQINSKGVVQVGHHRITVVDTPGFNDSFGNDRTHSNRLCQYLKGCGGINAFVLVRNGANVRFDAAFQAMLREYHAMFGGAFFTRLVIVATHIEGFIKMRFEQNQQEKALRDDICNLFRLNIEIPVIPIGFEGYNASLIAMANAIPVDKQQFQQTKSPIDELKRRRAAIANEEMSLNAQKQSVQTELNRVEAELSAL